MSEVSGSVIEVNNVSKRFGRVTAVDDVSFRVAAGERFFILGPSGCGKTTLLRILAGLEEQDRGRIVIGGTDTADLPPHRRGAPMVFQNYALWPHLDVHDNVAFGLVERRVPKKDIRIRVRKALERVDLVGLGERYPGQLSGGQQQRVVLARALVLDPAVLLLDEPLSNLDAKLRMEMREEIDSLHRQTGITFIYVTHDQTEALSLSDRLAVMNRGRLSAVGTPDDLYHRPPNLFCADFLGESNRFEGTIREVTDGGVCIDCGGRAWHAEAVVPATASPGRRATVIVRPENLESSRPAEPANAFEARIVSTRLTGATVAVQLDVDGQTVKATELSGRVRSLASGVPTTWYVRYSDTILLE